MNNLKWNWFDKIHEFDNGTFIILGAMPMKAKVLTIETRNDLIALHQLGVQSALCVVESFENNSNGFI